MRRELAETVETRRPGRSLRQQVPVDEGLQLFRRLGVAGDLGREDLAPVDLGRRGARHEQDEGRGGRPELHEVEHQAADRLLELELADLLVQPVVGGDGGGDGPGALGDLQEAHHLEPAVQDEVGGRRVHDLDGRPLVPLGGDEGDAHVAEAQRGVGITGQKRGQDRGHEAPLVWRHCREETLFCQIPE